VLNIRRRIAIKVQLTVTSSLKQVFLKRDRRGSEALKNSGSGEDMSDEDKRLDRSARVDFACRACLGVGFLVFVSLNDTVFDAVTHSGRHPVGVAFSAFACITALDYYVGAAVFNSGACIIGSLIASAVCSLTFLAFGDVRINESAVYPLIFIYSLFYSQLNIPAMGKKLGLSLFAINLITWAD